MPIGYCVDIIFGEIHTIIVAILDLRTYPLVGICLSIIFYRLATYICCFPIQMTSILLGMHIFLFTQRIFYHRFDDLDNFISLKIR